MWKLLVGLLKGGDNRKSVAGNLAWEIREAIKLLNREKSILNEELKKLE